MNIKPTQPEDIAALINLALEHGNAQNNWRGDCEYVFSQHGLQTFAAALATPSTQQATTKEAGGEALAEIVECETMGGQTVREIDGRWKFLKAGQRLYATSNAALERAFQDGVAAGHNQQHGLAYASAKHAAAAPQPAEAKLKE